MTDWIARIEGCRRGLDLIESAQPGRGDMATRTDRMKRGKQLLNFHYPIIAGHHAPGWCKDEIQEIEDRIAKCTL